MTKISFVFVAALSVAAFGCKKKGADCAKAINNSMELSKADMSKMPGMDDKMMEKMKDLGMQHCKDDKWSDDVLKCMSDAKTETDAQACYGKLPHDQQEKMNQDMMNMMKSGAGAAGGAAPGGAGGAAGGSGGAAGGAPGGDMGSAGAGSAPAGSGDMGGGSAGSAAAPK